MNVAKHLFGLALAVAAVYAGYVAYGEVGGWIRAVTQQPFRGYAESLGVSIETLRELRTVLTDLRLPLEVLAAFLGLSALHWLWMKFVGDAG